MEITYQQLKEAILAINQLPKDNSKRNYAIARWAKINKESIQSLHDRGEDINIEYCSLDEQGNILYDSQGNYRFSKEGVKAVKLAYRELMKEKINITPHITAHTDNVSEFIIEELTGIIF